MLATDYGGKSGNAREISPQLGLVARARDLPFVCDIGGLGGEINEATLLISHIDDQAGVVERATIAANILKPREACLSPEYEARVENANTRDQIGTLVERVDGFRLPAGDESISSQARLAREEIYAGGVG